MANPRPLTALSTNAARNERNCPIGDEESAAGDRERRSDKREAAPMNHGQCTQGLAATRAHPSAAVKASAAPAITQRLPPRREASSVFYDRRELERPRGAKIKGENIEEKKKARRSHRRWNRGGGGHPAERTKRRIPTKKKHPRLSEEKHPSGEERGAEKNIKKQKE